MIDAKETKRLGLSSDGRANEYAWWCGKCGTRGDVVDDFMGAVRFRQCPRAACGEENRISMRGATR